MGAEYSAALFDLRFRERLGRASLSMSSIALRARRARRHAGAGSASCGDERSVPEGMGFREAEVVPARPRLPFVVQPARLVVPSRVDTVPC